MNFFAHSTDSPKKNTLASDIPLEIRQAVSVMGGDEPVAAVSNHDSTPVAAPAPVTKSPSPFLGGNMPQEEKKTLSEAPQSLAPVWNTPATAQFKPLFDAQPSAVSYETRRSKKWLFAGLALVVCAGVAFAVWYFLKERTVSRIASEPVEVPVVPVVGLAALPEQPYAVTSPNYLMVDVETVTAAGLKELLRQPQERILAANMTQPVEFLLTDKNNNPIAFSRFAYLMKLGLDPELLGALGEPFSLYLHNTNGKISMGFVLSLGSVPGKDPLQLQKEALLPSAFKSVLFDDVALPKEIAFRSGTYNGQAVRYVNIDTTKNVSFDYALRGTEWLMGTSKETLRAILDRR